MQREYRMIVLIPYLVKHALPTYLLCRTFKFSFRQFQFYCSETNHSKENETLEFFCAHSMQNCSIVCSREKAIFPSKNSPWHAHPKILLFPVMIFFFKPIEFYRICLLYTSPSPRDGLLSRMPSSA